MHRGKLGRVCEEKFHHLLAPSEATFLVGQQDTELGEPLVWASVVVTFMYMPRKSVIFGAILSKTTKLGILYE